MPLWPNKRQYPRFQVPGATVFYQVRRFLRSPMQESCPVFTLGKGGAGFGTHNRIRPGQKLSVVLNVPSEPSPLELQAQVVYCIPHPGLSYPFHIGVAFAPFAGKGGNSQEGFELLSRLEEIYGTRGRE